MSLWRRLQRAFAGPPSKSDPPAALRPGGLDLAKDAGESALAPDLFENSLLERSVGQLIQQGREGRALELLGRLATARPQDAAPLLRLSELLCARREYRQALPVLARLVDLAPTLKARDLLSQAYEALGERGKAARQLEVILAEDFDYPQARPRYARLGERAEAAQEMLVLGPRPAAALPTLGGAGEVQHQRYRLVRELGRGSAGTVYLGFDTELQRELAVKIFHPRGHAGAGQNEVVARAWNEARLMAVVRHPGVVSVYELDDVRNLVVMELCRGGTLRQRLSEGRLPAAISLRRAKELLTTLSVVHGAGVVHGDIKPGNLLFRGAEGGADEEARYGDLVLVDFGMARLLGGEEKETHSAAGTLGYVAPERRRHGAPLAPTSDLYAAGAILVEMCNGALPLSRTGLLLGERLPVTIGSAAAELGPKRHAVEALLRGLLHEDPALRPSATAALKELSAIC